MSGARMFAQWAGGDTSNPDAVRIGQGVEHVLARQRAALITEARNLGCGASVWSSPRAGDLRQARGVLLGLLSEVGDFLGERGDGEPYKIEHSCGLQPFIRLSPSRQMTKAPFGALFVLRRLLASCRAIAYSGQYDQNFQSFRIHAQKSRSAAWVLGVAGRESALQRTGAPCAQ